MHVNQFVESIHREFENNGVAYPDLFLQNVILFLKESELQNIYIYIYIYIQYHSKISNHLSKTFANFKY